MRLARAALTCARRGPQQRLQQAALGHEVHVVQDDEGRGGQARGAGLCGRQQQAQQEGRWLGCAATGAVMHAFGSACAGPPACARPARSHAPPPTRPPRPARTCHLHHEVRRRVARHARVRPVALALQALQLGQHGREELARLCSGADLVVRVPPAQRAHAVPHHARLARVGRAVHEEGGAGLGGAANQAQHLAHLRPAALPPRAQRLVHLLQARRRPVMMWRGHGVDCVGRSGTGEEAARGAGGSAPARRQHRLARLLIINMSQPLHTSNAATCCTILSRPTHAASTRKPCSAYWAMQKPKRVQHKRCASNAMHCMHACLLGPNNRVTVPPSTHACMIVCSIARPVCAATHAPPPALALACSQRTRLSYVQQPREPQYPS